MVLTHTLFFMLILMAFFSGFDFEEARCCFSISGMMAK